MVECRAKNLHVILSLGTLGNTAADKSSADGTEAGSECSFVSAIVEPLGYVRVGRKADFESFRARWRA
jgi:hypothetical protein